MSGQPKTELRDLSEVGAELDESLLEGITGGYNPNAARTRSGAGYDDYLC
ncbi:MULTISPECIES: hypothetical protein [Microbispora]|uniref:Lasso RiPP family leader peptide-containing protein n=1 Tax=Microbispora siamensis TaxID=564413 RepID=A0ABQ4GHT3_9ACTN|nr:MULTISPECIES: hypothetical protein [Microbispora]GIH60910.1 hypothetical protein Msi02_17270 [Microbispora siamensis]